MSGSRPSILWVSEEVPDRDGGGGNIRQANLVLGMAEQVDIHLLVAGPVVDAAVRAAARSVTEVVPLPSTASRAASLWALFARRVPLTVTAAMGVIAALRPAVAAAAPTHDLVVVHHAALSPLLTVVRGPLRVTHPYHVASQSATQAAAVAATWRSRLVWRAEARAQRRLERRVVRDSDVLVTCSQEDAAALLGDPPAAAPPLIVSPNGVDLDRFRPVPLPGARRVLFFGSLDYPPNVDGIVWFVESIWPTVRELVPDAELSIVGRHPAAAVVGLDGRPGVRVVGDVPAAAPWYESSDVVVVPLRIGTGTRLKALEAMAAGRPVVGTVIGMEGLRLEEPGADPDAATVVDEPAAFARAVADCLVDPVRAQRMAAAGRGHVEQHYGWPVIAEALAAQLADLARAARAGSR